MSEPHRPPVRPITWATLGLLGFCWLVVGGLWAYTTVADKIPPGLMDLFVWLVITGPLYLFALTAWLSRRDREARLFHAWVAGLYAVDTVTIVTIGVLLKPRDEAMLFPQCGWLFGWPVSLVTLLIVASLPPSPDAPPDDDPPADAE